MILDCFSRPFLILLARQFLVGEPLAYNLRDSEVEAVSIAQWLPVYILAVVKAKSLLVNVAEQVIWFDADMRTVDAAFQKAPEVLASIRVNVLADMLYGVVDHLVLVLPGKAIVGLQRVREQSRSRFNVLPD